MVRTLSLLIAPGEYFSTPSPLSSESGKPLHFSTGYDDFEDEQTPSTVPPPPSSPSTRSIFSHLLAFKPLKMLLLFAKAPNITLEASAPAHSPSPPPSFPQLLFPPLHRNPVRKPFILPTRPNGSSLPTRSFPLLPPSTLGTLSRTSLPCVSADAH